VSLGKTYTAPLSGGTRRMSVKMPIFSKIAAALWLLLSVFEHPIEI